MSAAATEDHIDPQANVEVCAKPNITIACYVSDLAQSLLSTVADMDVL